MPAPIIITTSPAGQLLAPPPSISQPQPANRFTTPASVPVDTQQPGSAGNNTQGTGQAMTPYGGIYPQPATPPSQPSAVQGGLLSTTAAPIRPLENIRTVVVTSGPVNAGQTSWSYSNVLNFNFTIQDVTILTDAVSFASTVRFGSASGTVIDGPSADSSVNFVLPYSASAPNVQRQTLPLGFTVLPLYGLEVYNDSAGARLWMEFVNNAAQVQNCAVIFTIVLEPGSETIP